MTRSSANREVSVCKKKRDSVKYLRRWISVAAAAALPTPRILTKYSRIHLYAFVEISLSLSLSLARALFSDRTSSFRISSQTSTTRFDTIVNVSWLRQKQQVVEIDDTTLTKKPFSSGYSFILPRFARARYRVAYYYIRDAIPTFSRFLFRCRRNFVREPPFLLPTL